MKSINKSSRYDAFSLRKTLRFTVAAATLALAVSSNAASLAKIKEKGVMKVVTEDSYAPFEMVKDGKPDGFDHDMIKALKEYASFTIESEIMPWTGLLTAVVAGKFDIAITGSLVSPERLEVFDFAPPIAFATHYAVVRADDDSVKTVADLAGKKMGIQAGSALITRLPELKAMLDKTGGKLGDMVEYTSYPEAYADLANGRVDYVINTFVPLSTLSKKRPNVFKLSVPVSGAGFHAWPVAKGNEELLTFITAFMNHMRETGKLDALQKKWFGEAMPDLPTAPIKTLEQYQTLTTPK